ncbi:unnamed protein product [Mytilus edulis]|uniref:Uncharacterized protein n=1 Tax=Mytilus edulis TaxID=6550 RepID=A0A8S3QR63_MYTED|nr:unnamed protein product [Mytilus edulis]
MDPGTDVDHVLQSLGNVGKYQKFQLSLLFVFMLENAFHLMAANYVSYRPLYNCKTLNETVLLQKYNIESNRSDIKVKYGKCNIDIQVNDTDAEYHSSQSCPNGYEYEIPKDRSTVTEWDLVCEGSVRSEFAQTLIMMGQAVGAAIFSPLSDRFGRKPINIISRILYTIAGVTAMFSPSIEVFSVYRLLIGTFQGDPQLAPTMEVFNIILPCADDIAFISNDKHELQLMLNMLGRYANEHHYSIHPTKTQIIDCSKTKSDYKWTLDGNDVTIAKSGVHLGLTRAENNEIHINADQHKFTPYTVDPTCQLCKTANEDITHFLATCPILSTMREKYFLDIRKEITDKITPAKWNCTFMSKTEIVQLLIDCSKYKELFDSCEKFMENIENKTRNIFIDESLRWLLANGKTDEAMKIIRKAASWNNQSFESVMESVEKKNLLVPKDLNIDPPENQEKNHQT